MGSTRLPGKVLLPLCGDTVLGVMLQRLSRFRDNIIIATTNDGSEEAIVALCRQSDIRCFQGDVDNVLKRYYDAAVHFGAQEGDTIVRLTSDCPFIDQEILMQMLQQFYSSTYDYYSNIFERSYPRGLDTEIFTFKTLERAFCNATTPFEKEHVTTYIHTTHHKIFKIGSFTDSHDNSKYRLTLDEAADYEAITLLYEQLGCQTDFSYAALLQALRDRPDIYEINAYVEQKKR